MSAVRSLFRSRLTVRLVLSHLLVIVVVLGVAGAALLAQSRRYFVDADRRALLIQARAAAASCGETCIATGRAAVDVRNATLPSGAVISQNRNITEEATTVDPSTQRIQTELNTTLTIIRAGTPTNDATVASALQGVATTRVSSPLLVAAAPIRRGSDVVGAALVRGDLADVEAVLRDLKRALIAVLAVSAVLATAVGFLRARAISKPIRALTKSVQAIADGDFSVHIPSAVGGDELSRLATAFASMRDRVTHELAARAAFVTDASHELRTPLTAIRGSVEILQDSGGDNPTVRAHFLGTLERETARLLALVNGLLDLDAGDRVAVREPVDLVVLIDSVIAQLQVVFPATIERRGADAVVAIGDPAQLRQVLLNLIDNACTHGGRTVQISARTKGCCVVEITDDGPGIAEADRERVVERFVRLDASRNRAGDASDTRDRGSGLGLAIVQAIVSAHGGRLAIRDRDSGPGTTIVVELPAQAAVS